MLDFALTHVDEVIDELITKGYFVCHCNAGHSCVLIAADFDMSVQTLAVFKNTLP